MKIKLMSTDTATIERWKPIKDFSHYEVSSLGRVRKPKRTDKHGTIREPKYISQVLNKNGYYYVNLADNTGKYHFKLVHRLVAAAFCGRPKEKSKVIHIDGNMTNNAADNLKWNTKVIIDEETVNNARFCSGKSVVQIDKVTGDVIATYKSQTEAAAAVGISQSNLSRAARIGITAGGYYWRYYK